MNRRTYTLAEQERDNARLKAFYASIELVDEDGNVIDLDAEETPDDDMPDPENDRNMGE